MEGRLAIVPGRRVGQLVADGLVLDGVVVPPPSPPPVVQLSSAANAGMGVPGVPLEGLLVVPPALAELDALPDHSLEPRRGVAVCVGAGAAFALVGRGGGSGVVVGVERAVFRRGGVLPSSNRAYSMARSSFVLTRRFIGAVPASASALASAAAAWGGGRGR